MIILQTFLILWAGLILINVWRFLSATSRDEVKRPWAQRWAWHVLNQPSSARTWDVGDLVAGFVLSILAVLFAGFIFHTYMEVHALVPTSRDQSLLDAAVVFLCLGIASAFWTLLRFERSAFRRIIELQNETIESNREPGPNTQ